MILESQRKTLAYYNDNAQAFMDNTFDIDMMETINIFAKTIPFQGKVLDVGCGSGRDTQQFLKLGFDVTAFDISEKLALLASEKINHPVLHMDMNDMPWENEFDGVWALASLLHLEKIDIPNAIEKCLKTLKENGVFFTSFKMGKGEAVDDKGRHFSYFTIEELTHLLGELPNVANFKVQQSATKDALGRDVNWINLEIICGPQLNMNQKRFNKPKV